MSRSHLLHSLALGSLVLSCGGGNNLASQFAKPPDVGDQFPNDARCGVTKSQAKPLVVEWSSVARGELEAKIAGGLVPVRYQGCEMEVLGQCKVRQGAYSYRAFTPKHESKEMRDADDLYANVPLGAAKLESKLEKSGALKVAMTIVGRYEADRVTVKPDELEGYGCEKATHVIASLTAGAFQFFAEGRASVGAGAGAFGASAGGGSESSRELLTRDGDESACESSRTGDGRPPERCGALIGLEVVPLVGVASGTAAAGAPTTGSAGCPSGMVAVPGSVIPRAGIDPFCLDETPVTAGAFKDCVTSGQCDIKFLDKLNDYDECNYGLMDKRDHPVNCVVWPDAAAFCSAQGKRLPTNEEWQWAAQAGDKKLVFPWGSKEPTSQLCWSGASKRSGTCPVASFPEGRSLFGLHDLLGNVWEWTSTSEPGNRGLHIIRGGSWMESQVFVLNDNSRHEPDEKPYDLTEVGFRCAKDR